MRTEIDSDVPLSDEKDKEPHFNIMAIAKTADIVSQEIMFCDTSLSMTPQSTWALDYPIYAYKSAAPDNKEIVIMHLGRKIP